MAHGRKTVPSRILVTWMIACVAGLLAAVGQQAQEEDATRQLWDTAFINQRNKAVTRKPTRRNYRIVTPRYL